MALDKFRAAPLPNPPAQWDPQYMRQVIRVLEVYFSQLDSNTPNHAQKYTANEFVAADVVLPNGEILPGTFTGTSITIDTVATKFLDFLFATGGYLDANGVSATALISGGQRAGRTVADDIGVGNIYADYFYGDGQHINTPYNQFQSNSDQTAASVADAYAVTYDVEDFPDGIYLTSSSRINVEHEGVYVFTFSIQFENQENSTETVDVWFRKNGTDVPNSNSSFSLPARKAAGVYSYLVAVTPFMIDLNAGDYIEIMWRASSTLVSIQQLPAVTANPGVTPAIPATPSVILTAQFISAQFPPTTYVPPLPVFGFGQIGTISVATG